MARDAPDGLVLLGRAFALQQAGRLADAEALYAQVLASTPDDATALVNGGAVGQFSTHPLVGGKVVNNTGVPDPQSPFGTTNDPAISTKTFPNLQQGVRSYYCQNHASTMQGVIFVK